MTTEEFAQKWLADQAKQFIAAKQYRMCYQWDRVPLAAVFMTGDARLVAMVSDGEAGCVYEFYTLLPPTRCGCGYHLVPPMGLRQAGRIDQAMADYMARIAQKEL